MRSEPTLHHSTKTRGQQTLVAERNRKDAIFMRLPHKQTRRKNPMQICTKSTLKVGKSEGTSKRAGEHLYSQAKTSHIKLEGIRALFALVVDDRYRGP